MFSIISIIEICYWTDPPFYTGQSLVTAIEGDETLITLDLSGNPLPLSDTLVWTFNGQSIQTEGRIILGLDSITFRNVERGDAGIYAVFSSNEAGGSNTFEFELEVFCKFHA